MGGATSGESAMKRHTFHVPVVVEVVAMTPEHAAHGVNSVLNGAVRFSELVTLDGQAHITDFALDSEAVERAGSRPLGDWFDDEALFERRRPRFAFILLGWVLAASAAAGVAAGILAVWGRAV